MTRANTGSTSQSKSTAAPPISDAITMLTQDHREVEKLFSEYEELGDTAKVSKRKLAQKICRELEIHMELEEKIFYPETKETVEDSEDLVNEGVVEHESAKKLMKEISKMEGDEELFDSKVMVLKELIEHHVEEEEDEMFPKVRQSSMDLQEIGERMAERKKKLAAK